MSNSSRIEAATRQHVGAILTSKMIQELVKLADPTDNKGVYPSDVAWKRSEDGTLVCRGKVPYGDGILEHLSDNSFKVLADNEIVRMARKRIPKATPAVEPPVAQVVAAPETAQKKAKKKLKKAAKKSQAA